ncbi:uncharacterized protein LOC100832865 [Brachypodium distachyon]|uniref:RING-type domain-containing protein n=1 Tax=Brachypodium distachyon TaxID=15368 RepID=I1HQA7_BRADI|nr:uncharacterized protein LOC100832865 [Brachypodium distachyon]KQK09150.1 hypothetical protein BRADI_2g46312v3 [Brachypodium distachyon]|eukprot:XP_003569546.1 uncharacterized protein LOC100832865 [Brachypodium distachyon]
MEVVDLVSSDSEDEACIHSPERKRPAWEADPSVDPRTGSACTRIGGHGTQSFLEQTRLKRPLHQPSVTVKKDKEKVGERESSWATGAPSLSGGSHGASGRILGAGWDSWNGRVSNSGDGTSEGDCFWGNQIGRSISEPREEPNNKDEVALSGQSSSMDIPDFLTESSSAWMLRIKGLHFPLPDENQLKARQIELDEMLALKLQEQFNREQPGSENSQEVDTTLAWTLQEEDTARARIAAREGQSSSSQRDCSMAHLYSYGRHSPAENFTSWTVNHTQAPISNRRWLPRNSNGPEFEKRNMIISQLTKGCFGQENLDFGMKIAILDSLQEALDSCEDTYTSDFEDDDYVNSIAFDDNNHCIGVSDSEIDSLPLSVVKGESCRDEPCPICLDYPADGASLRHLPCMHKFHKECIDRWLRMKTLCPVCKSSVI